MSEHSISSPVLAVLEDMARVVAGVRPEQSALPTPCEGFDVAALQQHLLGWLDLFRVALSDPAGRDRPEPSAYQGPKDPEAAAAEIRHVAGTVRAALENDVESGNVDIPRLGGELPGALVIHNLLAEVLGHGWDLARATGQRWDPDPAICEQALAALKPVLLPEYRGAGMPFGPEIDVSPDASALDRFVAFTGRSPDWAARAQG
ncbi:TIGR03086 family metal-binding protein [Streptoverticillium reticulum]|uniref:TIGR03086 family metal-binding protein n=1 Tax=Streptoverticillium reticulum TaxID=1433415 RepID=UPI0039BF63F4